MSEIIDFFVKELELMAPITDVKVFREPFFLKRKGVIPDAFTGPFDELLKSYNATVIDFEEFHLMESIEVINGYNVIAIGSHSYIGFSSESDDSLVVEFDRETYNFLYEVAENQVCFLKAILEMQKVYSNRLTKIGKGIEDLWDEKDIDRCTKIAGGERYRDFYDRIFQL